MKKHGKQTKKEKLGVEMKKLLILVAVLALVAALVVPMTVSAAQGGTGPVNITGDVVFVASQLTMVVPGNITQWSKNSWTSGDSYNWLTVGDNYGSGTPGSITFVQGNDGVTGWKLTTTLGTGYSLGKMYCYDSVNDFLPAELQLTIDSGANVYDATLFNGWSTTGSTSSALTLGAKQVVGTTDKAGTYSFVIVYTLTPQ